MTDNELYDLIVVQFRSPGPEYMSACCRLLRTYAQKLANQRLRMDEMWNRQHDLGKTIADTHSRSARLGQELNDALNRIKELEAANAAMTERLVELLNVQEH